MPRAHAIAPTCQTRCGVRTKSCLNASRSYSTSKTTPLHAWWDYRLSKQWSLRLLFISTMIIIMSALRVFLWCVGRFGWCVSGARMLCQGMWVGSGCGEGHVRGGLVRLSGDSLALIRPYPMSPVKIQFQQIPGETVDSSIEKVYDISTKGCIQSCALLTPHITNALCSMYACWLNITLTATRTPVQTEHRDWQHTCAGDYSAEGRDTEAQKGIASIQGAA